MTRNCRYFGTDGIRGRVGHMPITAEFVVKLGWAAGKILLEQSVGSGAVLIGKDTRISGYMLESALQAGLSAAGIDIFLVGPMPTPAIAYLTRTLRANAGIVISASHNPYYDNGIKFFSSEGVKLSDELEENIEKQLDEPFVTVEKLGKAARLKDAPGRYIEFCKSCLPHHTTFKDLKLVIDCANGATYHVAPNVFRELGAKVIELSTEPNGLNINQNCGSMHTELLQKYVLQEKADMGIAFDGDGDRVVMVDHMGEIVDGDELVFIMAKNRLTHQGFFGGVIGTHMSNLGLELGLKNLKIPFKRTMVGDRHVLMALEQEKWILGGESSGHIICLDVTTTGDGIISALRILQALKEAGKNLHELKLEMKKFPQVVRNIHFVNNNIDVLNTPQVKKIIQNAEDKLGRRGRVLIRRSGTEAVIRVMVEGEDRALVELLVNEIAEALELSVGKSINI